MSRPIAEKFGLALGSAIELHHVHQVKRFETVGILEPEGLALIEGGEVSIVDIAAMQEFTGLQGRVDRIDVVMAPDARKEDLDRIRSVLPPGVLLQAPTESRETGLDLIRAYQLNLSLLSFVSLFVGMFLVYSLVSLNAASRRHELAILKSLGASSRLVLMLVLSEGFLLGVIGWLLAIPVGALLVNSMVEGVSNTVSNLFVRVHPEGLHLNGWEILLSFGVTVFISLAAAYGPARETLNIVPKEALATQGACPPNQEAGRRGLWTGLLFILLVWPLSKLPDMPGIPLSGYLAVLFLVMGFSMLAPFALRRMGALLSPAVRRMAGEGSFLGTRYVRDSGRRSAIAVGALVVAVSLFVALTIMIHSFRHTVSLWVQQTVQGDFYMRPGMAGLNQYRHPMPEDVVAELRKLPDDMSRLPYRRIYLTYRRTPYQLEAFDFDVFSRFGKLILGAALAAALPAGRMVLRLSPAGVLRGH